MSMKNPLTLAGIEPATFRFVAQHLNHCATAVPDIIIQWWKIKLNTATFCWSTLRNNDIIGDANTGIILFFEYVRTLIHEGSLLFLGAFAKLRKATINYIIYSPMQQLGSHRTDFHEIWYLSIFFFKSVEKIQVSLKMGHHHGYCTWKSLDIFDHTRCGRKVTRLAPLCTNRQSCCLPLPVAVRLTPAVDSVQVWTCYSCYAIVESVWSEVAFVRCVTKMDRQKFEQSCAIKFCVKLGESAAVTYEKLQRTYGEHSLSRAQVFRRHKSFLEGREQVEDEPCAGRPSTSKTDDKVETLRSLVRSDLRLTLRMISSISLISSYNEKCFTQTL